MKPIIRTFIYLITLSLVLLSSSVTATDQKIYSGSMCQARVHSEDVESLNRSSFGLANSSYTHAIAVTCPIVRDNTLNTNGTRFAQVRVLNRRGGNFPCYLSSLTRDGGFIERGVDVTVGASITPVVLNVDVNSSAALGYYTISCDLPPRAYILNYLIDEY